MTPESIATFISNQGVAIAMLAFIGLGFWKASAWGANLATNHLVHLQQSLDSMNQKLDRLIELTERNLSK